jgi:hypothetical protein
MYLSGSQKSVRRDGSRSVLQSSSYLIAWYCGRDAGCSLWTVDCAAAGESAPAQSAINPMNTILPNRGIASCSTDRAACLADLIHEHF